MEPTFQLFRLPKNVVVRVLQNMNLNQLFIISLISSKTKRLVISLGIEVRDVSINIIRKISVCVYTTKSHLTLNFYDDSNDQNDLSPIDISLPVAASFGYQGTRIQSSTPFNFSNWINHIRTVFCCTRPPNIRFYQGCEKYEIELLEETIGNVNVLFVCSPLTHVLSKEILKHFNAPSELFLYRNPFEEACQIQKTFIKNFETIEFDDVHSLDDMLSVNSKNAEFYRPTTQKQFNQFLKHWIRGSNPRLQYMFLLIDKTDFVNGEVYLNGIRFMEMSEDAKKEIRRKHRLLVNVDMIQIKRKDGTFAVIGTEDSENTLNIYFFVLD